VPQHIANEYNRCASLLVSPRSSGTNTPLKVYEQLASGVPLLATKIHSHTQVLDASVAFLVDPNPESMAAGMRSALESKQQRQAVAERAKALYRRDYARPVYKQKMTSLLEAIS
jgi:glycosyltransferase involved in cell wall biosynthesis